MRIARYVDYVVGNNEPTYLTSGQIRYHGKSSGLHLLGRSDRKDDRNEGGIWYALGFLFCWIFFFSSIIGGFPWHEFGPVPPVVHNTSCKKRACM
jgi:hypothetical protein